MCAQAISLMRIKNLYYGADDLKGGGIKHGPKVFDQHSCNHRPTINSGILFSCSPKSDPMVNPLT